MTRVGKYLFTANTGSKTVSRLIGTGNNVFVDSPVAATIATGGGPSDIDAVKGTMGVIDRGGGQSHLSLFAYNRFGELTASGSPITIGANAQRNRHHAASPCGRALKVIGHAESSEHSPYALSQ